MGYSSFEVLTYRWGVASLCLGAYGVLAGCDFRLGRRGLGTVFLLSLFRAATSLSLVIAYQNIASGVASTIHFMYPLVVAVVMMCFFRERGSAWTFAAIGMSIVGAVLLSLGNARFHARRHDAGNRFGGRLGRRLRRLHRGRAPEPRGGDRLHGADLLCDGLRRAVLHRRGPAARAACASRPTRIRGFTSSAWLMPATAVSNMALVQAIKSIGPTLTSIFGAMEPLTAVVIGIWVFAEPFTAKGAARHPADRGGGVGRGPAQPERVAGGGTACGDTKNPGVRTPGFFVSIR